MKSFFTSILILAFSAALFSSCANDDFAVPNIDCNEPTLNPTKTIKELSDMATKTPVQLTGEDIVTGVVVSSDKGGNFYKELYLISDDSIAFRVPVNEANLHTYYNTGRRVFINLKGLYIQKSNGILQIGDLFNFNVGQINSQTYRKHLTRACKVVSEDALIHKVTLADLKDNDNYVGKLLTVENVQFQALEVNGTYYDSSNVLGGQTNRLLEDNKGNTLIFRTSSFAEYSGDVVPNNSGSITGVLTKFETNDRADYQFIARSRNDIQLDKDRFGTDGEEPGPDPGDGEEPEVTGELAFLGADFEDWSVFMAQLTSHGLKEYASQQVGQGMSTSNAIGFIGTPAGNDYVFTIENNQNVPINADKISFFIKGTAAKSLSINLYRSNGTNFDVYNLESVTSSKTITANTEMNSQGNGTNQYNGTINTNGNWIKITLDLAGVDYNTSGSGSFIAFKVGKDAAYDLLIDNVMIEGGEVGGNPDPDPNPGDESLVFPGADFEDWSVFEAQLTSHGLKAYATQLVAGGRNGSNALGISGTPTGNDYVFTVENVAEVPAGKTKISFWVKGDSEKSLSLNIYQNDGSYKAFNVVDLTADKTIAVAGNNQYTGVIDTGGVWVKVTLDLTGVDYNTSGAGSLLALKVGKDAAYNLAIDDFQFE